MSGSLEPRRKFTRGKRSFAALAETSAPRTGVAAERVRWPYTLAGLALVPLLASTVSAFWRCFSAATLHHALWKTAELWFFLVGITLWLICLAGFRTRMFHLVYVFGHEWTHALAAISSGGRVLRFPVISATGGHVVTDRNSLFITLAPYVVPFFSVLVATGFGCVQLFHPLPEGALWVLYTALGFTWAFHATFTVRTMRIHQPDFEQAGRFFSSIVIGFGNACLLSLLLVLASPNISVDTFFRVWLDQTVRTVAGICRFCGAG